MKKQFLALLCFSFILPIAFLLSACGGGGGSSSGGNGGGGGNSDDNQLKTPLSSLDISFGSASSLHNKYNIDNCTLTMTPDEFEAFFGGNKNQGTSLGQGVVVRANYVDGTSEILSRYEYAIVNHLQELNPYDFTLEIRYLDDPNRWLYIDGFIRNQLPAYLFNGVDVFSTEDDMSHYLEYNLNEALNPATPQNDIRYTGSPIDAAELVSVSIVGSSAAPVSLKSLIDEGKLTVVESDFCVRQETEPNYIDGFGNYSNYSLIICPAPGYSWDERGGYSTDTEVNIYWSIKRAILPTPIVNGSTTLTYNGNYQSPNVDYHGNEDKFVPISGLDAGEYLLQLSLGGQETQGGYISYQDYYCMIIENKEETIASLGNWQIAPKVLGISDIVFTTPQGVDTVLYDSETIPVYTYTGSAIKPSINILDASGNLLSDYVGIFEVDGGYTDVNYDENDLGEPYIYNVRFASITKFRAENPIEEGGNVFYNYAQNYRWNDGSLILIGTEIVRDNTEGNVDTSESDFTGLVYRYKFYIKQSDGNLPTGFNPANVRLNDIEFNDNQDNPMTYQLWFGNGDSSFTSETISYLNSFNMFTNWGPDSTGFSLKDNEFDYVTFSDIGVKNITLLWYPGDQNSVTPVEINVTVNLVPKKIVVDPENMAWYMSQDENNNYEFILGSYHITQLGYYYSDSEIINCFTYKNYFYDENQEGQDKWVETTTYTDAGNYKTVATFNNTSYGGAQHDYNYYNTFYKIVNSSGIEVITFTKQWIVDKTSMSILTVENFENNSWKTTYNNETYQSLNCYGSLPVGATQSFEFYTDYGEASSYFDLSNITYTIYKKNGSNWDEVNNLSTALGEGEYKTTATISFKSGVRAANYNVAYSPLEGEQTQETNGANSFAMSKIWYVYPDTIALQVNDKDGANYIGYYESSYNYAFDGRPHAPEVGNSVYGIPDYIRVFYTFTSYVNNSYTTLSDKPSVIGNYASQAGYYLFKNYLGWDSVSITITSSSTNNYTPNSDGWFFTTPTSAQFTIEEIINNTSALVMNQVNQVALNPYVNYFQVSIATDGQYVFMLAKSAQESSEYIDSMLYYKIKDSTSDWNYVYRSELNFSYYYYVVSLTQGDIMFRFFTNANPQTCGVGVLNFDDTIDYNFNNQNGTFSVARKANVVKTSEVTIPSQIYYNYDNYYVSTIEANGFKNDTTLQTIYLPRSIATIGAEAFSGCSNLTHIYYDGNEDEWGGITIGADAFVNCNEDLLIVCNNGIFSPYGNVPSGVIVVSYNPQIELIISKTGVVVSVTQQGDDFVDLSNILGLDKTYAIKSIVNQLDSIGYIKLDQAQNLNNQLVITYGGNDSATLVSAINDYVSTNSLGVLVSAQGVAANYLNDLVRALYPNKTDSEIAAMSERAKWLAVMEARNETRFFKSQDLKDLYYIEKAAQILKAKANSLISALSSNSVSQSVIDDLSDMLDNFNATYNTFEENYINNYLAMTSNLFMAKRTWAGAKDSLLNAALLNNLNQDLIVNEANSLNSVNSFLIGKNSAINSFIGDESTSNTLRYFAKYLEDVIEDMNIDFVFNEGTVVFQFNHMAYDLSIRGSLTINSIGEGEDLYVYEEIIGSETLEYHFRVLNGNEHVCYLVTNGEIVGQINEIYSWGQNGQTVTLYASPNVTFTVENGELVKSE